MLVCKSSTMCFITTDMQKDRVGLNLSIYQKGYTKTIVLAKHSGLVSEITDTTADTVS